MSKADFKGNLQCPTPTPSKWKDPENIVWNMDRRAKQPNKHMKS